MTDYKVPIADSTNFIASDVVATDANKKLIGIATPVKNYTIIYNGTTPVWAVQGTTFTFSIATFTWSGYAASVEIGTGTWKAAGTLSFTATYTNGPPDATPYVFLVSPGWVSNLLMTGAGYVGPTVNTEIVTYPAINGTRVLELAANVGAETSTYIRTTTFYNKKYFGFNSQTTILDSAKTIALANNAFVITKTSLVTAETTLTPTGSQYIHFLYPSRIDPTTITFKINGFNTTFTNLGTFTFTNASGYAESYRDYVSPQAYDASLTLQVLET